MSDPLPIADVIARLNAFRLDRDMTWMQLTALAQHLDISISMRTLNIIMTGRGRVPRDRTAHKLRKLLERLDALDTDTDTPPAHDPATTSHAA